MLSEFWKNKLKICSKEERGAVYHADLTNRGWFNSLANPLMSESQETLGIYCSSLSLFSNLSNGTKLLPTVPRATEDGGIICESAINMARHNTPRRYACYWANEIYFIMRAGINMYFTRYCVHLII